MYNTPFFPTSIWDGTAIGHEDRHDDKAANYSMTDRLISEIIATQTSLSAHLTNLAAIDSLGNANEGLVVNAAGTALVYAAVLHTGGLAGGQVAIGGSNAGDDLTLQSTSHATRGDVICVDRFIVDQVSDPTIRLRENSSGTAYFQIRHASATQTVFEHINDSGIVQIDYNPRPDDNTSAGIFRFFRETNTTGEVAMYFYIGNGTSTLNNKFSGNRDSYVCANNSQFGVGLVSPISKAHIFVADGEGIACLELEQEDDSEPFIEFDANSGNDTSTPITTLTGGNTAQGHLKISVNGVDRFIPFFDAPTS